MRVISFQEVQERGDRAMSENVRMSLLKRSFIDGAKCTSLSARFTDCGGRGQGGSLCSSRRIVPCADFDNRVFGTGCNMILAQYPFLKRGLK